MNCQHCYRAGDTERVKLIPVGTDGPIKTMHLCQRCAAVPTATWRRHFDKVYYDAGQT